MTDVLRLGTRRSLMAMTQSRAVADALTARTGQAVELVGVTTYGDVSPDQLTQIGGTGVFVTAIRERLLAGEIDLAVHSLKDLPTAGPAELVLAAFPVRDDPFDALVTATGAKFADLAPGSRVGTGSPRRVAQLRALRPDLEYVGVRGNADTRLGRLTSGELDAVVLAHAGLGRIGRLDGVSDVFDSDRMLPAPGQGALAVECRADRLDLIERLAVLDNPWTRAAVLAERAVLAGLEGGCSAPVGAYATCDAAQDRSADPRVYLTAAVVAIDGTRSVRMTASGPIGEAAAVGGRLAAEMLAEGAARLMGEQRS